MPGGPADRFPRGQRAPPHPIGCPPGTLGEAVPVSGRLEGLGASPPFAGNKANVVGLAVRVNPPCLPPLLITGIDDMQHVPKVEAKGLAQESAVLGLVVVKQGPGGQMATGQSLAEDPSHRGPAQRSGAGSTAEHAAMALPRCLGSEQPKSSEGPKALLLLTVIQSTLCS